MRIAIVHSFYSSDQPSGENQAVLEQVEILRSAGHEVELIEYSTDDLEAERAYQLRAAARVASGIGRNPRADLDRFKPDVVHVHNLFPNVGETWIEKCPYPVVVTLHNFRPVCANGLLFRDGRKCVKCLDGNPWHGVQHGCYRGSRLATLPLVARMSLRSLGGSVLQSADRLICLSQQAADIYASYGVTRERLRVVPNGVTIDSSVGQATRSNGRWVVAGRLSEEKGLSELAAAWPSSVPLDVYGDGPLRQELEAVDLPWTFLGAIPRAELVGQLPKYEGLVFPSQCLEMQPTVVVEALGVGLPVVALSGNAGAEIVSRLGGGFAYLPGDLATALADAAERRTALGDEGRTAFRNHFSAEAWVNAVEGIYRDVAGQGARLSS